MRLLKYGAVLLFLMTLWGCGTGGGSKEGSVPAAAVIDPETNKHPAGMAVAFSGGLHVAAYFQTPASCEGCHGKATELGGGTSRISCSTVSRSGISCHAGKWPHGFGFDDSAAHGARATNSAVGFNGIGFCRKCHGNDYRGIAGSGVSCIACHRSKGSNPATNAPHPSPWKGFAADHKIVHSSNLPACADCHWKRDLNTATAKPGHVIPAGITPTCTDDPANVTAVCHARAAHPTPYTAWADHGVDALPNLTYCGGCHADNTVSPPVFNKTLNANLTPGGCQKCHTQAGLAHPFGWLPGRPAASTKSHAFAGQGTNGTYCSPCHALSGPTPPGAQAPSCMETSKVLGAFTVGCHSTSSPVTTPSGCASCHGSPPAIGKHVKHVNAGIVCATCHLNRGSGTATHATGTKDTNFDATYQAFNGGAPVAIGYAGGDSACSNVSCHGGQPTGLWQTGGAVACLNCHNDPAAAPVTAQYNDVYSGMGGGHTGDVTDNLHKFHLTGPVFGIAGCTTCHDTNLLVAGTTIYNNHFGYLSGHDITGTQPYDTPIRRASQSIKFSGFLSSNLAVYTRNAGAPPPQKGTCSTMGPCHTAGAATRSW